MSQVLLTIAGTDPTGGAGVQVDLQVFRDYGFHGASVITSVLWQNSSGVRGIRALDESEVAEQIEAVLEDVAVAGIKIGLVPTPRIARTIVALLPSYEIPIVWDPVLWSGDGEVELTTRGMARALREAMAFVDVFTPNVLEAEQLRGKAIQTRADAHDAAGWLIDHDAHGVLLKAGHLDHGEELRDVWADAQGVRDLSALPAVDADVRGTGCQLSSAIVAELALGKPKLEALESAREYLSRLLHERRVILGRGRPQIVRI